MSRNRTLTYLLPGDLEHEYWEMSAVNGLSTKASRRSSGPCIYCFGTRSLYALPLWVSSTDENVIEGAVRMQLENRHIGDFTVKEGQHHDYFTVGKDGNRTQVLATVLAAEPHSYEISGNLDGFELAPRFYPLSGSALGLWKEDHQWVAAFYRQGHLAYFQALSARDFDGDLISEVQCAREWLDGAGFIDKISSISIWDTLADPVSVREMGERLDAPATISVRPTPVFPGESTALTPESFARRTKKESRQKMWMRIATVGLILYMAIMAMAMFGIIRTQRANTAEKQWISRNEDEAAEVAEAKARWDELQPAIDANAYPLELFYRVASLLPEESIRLTRFEANGRKISISGEASSGDAAISWRAKLEKDPLFEEYTWEFPQPKIENDNRATFNAEANPK